MIDRVSGVLESVETQQAVLRPEGPAAIRVLLPAYLAERLGSRIGEAIELHTFFYLEAQGQGTSFLPRLIGFGSPTERAFFELFTTVKGVGSRKALRAMAAEPAAIAAAIVGRNTKALIELPEIGKRLAETIVAELDGKVARFLSTAELDAAAAETSATCGPTLDGPEAEALAALTALGESPADAERMVRAAAAIEPKPETSAALIQAAYRVGR
ncbi:MAG: Holliday junction branch migration protein RuvA [Planctomycetota bacterium]